MPSTSSCAPNCKLVKSQSPPPKPKENIVSLPLVVRNRFEVWSVIRASHTRAHTLAVARRKFGHLKVNFPCQHNIRWPGPSAAAPTAASCPGVGAPSSSLPSCCPSDPPSKNGFARNHAKTIEGCYESEACGEEGDDEEQDDEEGEEGSWPPSQKGL